MDFKEQFSDILSSSETVVWVGQTDQKAYVKSRLLTTLLVMLFMVITIPLIAIVFTIFLPLLLHVNKRKAANTYFCVTDKAVIKKYGYFRPQYEQLKISDIAKIDISTRVTDSKENNSSTLVLQSRYHAGENAIILFLENVPQYQEVYKLINEEVEKAKDVLNAR